MVLGEVPFDPAGVEFKGLIGGKTRIPREACFPLGEPGDFAEKGQVRRGGVAERFLFVQRRRGGGQIERIFTTKVDELEPVFGREIQIGGGVFRQPVEAAQGVVPRPLAGGAHLLRRRLSGKHPSNGKSKEGGVPFQQIYPGGIGRFLSHARGPATAA